VNPNRLKISKLSASVLTLEFTPQATNVYSRSRRSRISRDAAASWSVVVERFDAGFVGQQAAKC
jgi:hypothetical protein